LPIPGLAEAGALTNETLFDLREVVGHLVIIGSGPIGSEMAQAFRRLGSEVSVIDIAPRILPREDADMADVVYRRMLEEGVRFHFESSIAKVEGKRGDVRVTVKSKDGAERTIAATHVLVAAGRKPNVETLALDVAGVQLDKGRIVSDARLRTTNPRIYVVGDVAGGYQFTHVAEHHAGIVLRQAIFKLFWTKPSKVVPWCTYTDPELARVGPSEDEAKQQGIAHKVYRFGFDEIDRARAEGETEGFAKLVTDPSGRILGAAIVGPHAGELIAEYVLAVSKGMKAGDISASIHTYPTLASINRRVADQRLKEGLTPTSKAWIKRVFGLQGA
ncbi:MAG: dihydrolipoyl dehydrogenase family protein, partial [Vicinamibacteria bacterium]